MKATAMRPVEVISVIKKKIETPEGPEISYEPHSSKTIWQSGYGETILLHKRLNAEIKQKGLSDELNSNIAQFEAHRMQQNMTHSKYENIMLEIGQQMLFITQLDGQTEEGHALRIALAKKIGLDPEQIARKPETTEVHMAPKPNALQTVMDICDPKVSLIETGKRVIAAQKMYLFGL